MSATTTPTEAAARLPLVDFEDSSIFPSFRTLIAGEDDQDTSHPYALVARIRFVERFTRLVLNCEDREGYGPFRVAFYTPQRGEEMNSKVLKEGHTVVALYPEAHAFADGTVGLRIEEERQVKVSES